MERAAADGATLRRRLAGELRRAGALRSERIEAAFLDVPRELFVPELAEREGLAAVYENRIVVTKTDARGVPLSSSSEPQVMAAMLERLDVRPGMRVLEIGAGSGYNAALLDRLVGAGGRVTSIELDPDLARKARRALRAGGYAARVVRGDGRLGRPADAPFDRIVAGASSPAIPRAWLDQLVDGGLLELPLEVSAGGPQAIATFRRAGRRLESVSVVPGRFMPLRRDGAGPGEPRSLTVEQQLDRGGKAVLTRLAGPGLERLSLDSLARLATLTTARVRPLGVRFPAWPLGLYLALEVPAGRQVTRYADLAVGLVGRGGRRLALVPGRWEGGQRPTAQRLVSYGAADAERRLAAVLEAWEARGRPGVRELRIEVDFRGGRSRVSHAWSRPG